MQPSPYLIECSKALGMIKEYESDGLLMQLVRLQQIALRVPRSLINATPPSTQSQIKMQINLLQEQLTSFMNNLPLNMRHNRKFLEAIQVL